MPCVGIWGFVPCRVRQCCVTSTLLALLNDEQDFLKAWLQRRVERDLEVYPIQDANIFGRNVKVLFRLCVLFWFFAFIP